MGWLIIEQDNLPEGEVLAGNFTPRTYGYKEKLVGTLVKAGGEVVCENGDTMLYGCTHYIDINKFDPV